MYPGYNFSGGAQFAPPGQMQPLGQQAGQMRPMGQPQMGQMGGQMQPMGQPTQMGQMPLMGGQQQMQPGQMPMQPTGQQMGQMPMQQPGQMQFGQGFGQQSFGQMPTAPGSLLGQNFMQPQGSFPGFGGGYSGWGGSQQMHPGFMRPGFGQAPLNFGRRMF